MMRSALMNTHPTSNDVKSDNDGDTIDIASRSSSSGNVSSSAPQPRSVWYDWLSEHGSRMLLFARQQTRTVQDAEDILQDCLVKLARMVDEGTFDGGEAQWRPFLYTAIRRRAIDLGRRNDRRSKREEKSEADRLTYNGGFVDPWFEKSHTNDESRVQLEAGLKKLPEKFSEVIVMKIWGEHTFAQIAEILDTSLNTVASRYRYGLERLRKSLESKRSLNDL